MSRPPVRARAVTTARRVPPLPPVLRRLPPRRLRPLHTRSQPLQPRSRDGGSEGKAVEQLQSALNEHGASLAVDGKFGKLTHGAVKDFQRTHGVQLDGVVGPETRGALNGGAASISGGGTSAPA